MARLLLSVGFPCLNATGVASFPHIVLWCHNIFAYVETMSALVGCSMLWLKRLLSVW